jgi:hypothetical protein
VRTFAAFQKEGLDRHAVLGIFRSLTLDQQILLGTPEAFGSEARTDLHRLVASRLVPLRLTGPQNRIAAQLLVNIAEVEWARTLFLASKSQTGK